MVICTLHSLRSRFPFSLVRMLSDLGNIACADQVILELTNSQRLEEALTRKQERDSSLPATNQSLEARVDGTREATQQTCGGAGGKKTQERRAKSKTTLQPGLQTSSQSLLQQLPPLQLLKLVQHVQVAHALLVLDAQSKQIVIPQDYQKCF
jgi:hypothetical protein